MLVEQGKRDEFSAMMEELARALLEVGRGEDERGHRRLERFEPDSKPMRVQHAFADSFVALADIVSDRSPNLAVAAYRKSRRVYREIKSSIDLHGVRTRVYGLSGVR